MGGGGGGRLNPSGLELPETARASPRPRRVRPALGSPAGKKKNSRRRENESGTLQYSTVQYTFARGSFRHFSLLSFVHESTSDRRV